MEVMIEVTRQCNQECLHCLRGEAQNKKIKHEYITSLLNQLRELEVGYTVVFTGGEPTLNLNAIRHYISECKRLSMRHDSFYIATNGFKLDLEFIGVCLELYAMSEEKELCQVHLSNDEQHKFIFDEDKDLIKGLSFFSDKHEESFSYYNRRPILEGRAKDYFSEGNDNYVYKIKNKEDLNSTEVYLNCNGNIINGCDWSYQSQNKKELILCKVEDFKRYYASLPEAEHELVYNF